MAIVSFFDCSFEPCRGLTYSVIASRCKGRWIVVRHRERLTWEIPGGHIEENESSDEAAHRELREETGAEQFTISCVATYSVEKDGKTGYGRLYFAEVTQLGTLSPGSEIAEVKLTENLPEKLTYPDILPAMIDRVLEFIG